MPRILIDGDACPVKAEVYKVAERYQAPVTLVANSYLRIPDSPLIEQVTVSDGFDAADNWIAEKASADCIVITSDILLAERCLKVEAIVLAPNGKAFTKNSIGAAVATRAIMADLRAGAVGEQIGGPSPFQNKDRSRFLSALDEALVRLRRQARMTPPPRPPRS